MFKYNFWNIRLDHNYVFLVGFIYYLISPLVVGFTGFLSGYPGYDNWYKDFYKITAEELRFYLYFISFMFLSFYMGSLLASFFKRIKNIDVFIISIKENNVMVFYSVIFYSIVTLALVFYTGGISLTGYQSYDVKRLGMLATLLLIWIFILIYLHQYNYRKVSFISIFNILFLFLLMLGLGARMYVVSSFLSIAFYLFFSTNKKISFKCFFIIATFFLIMLFIGVWRVGLAFEFSNFMYIFLSEPAFTWWSTSTLLHSNELFNFNPQNYISSFVNLIPRPFFPDKNSYIFNIADQVSFQAPLGATSIVVSLLGNFGFLFSLVYIFIFSVFLSICKFLSYRNYFFRFYYVYLISILMFSFFRDDFSIVNKLIFLNGFILPLILIFVWRFFYKLSSINRGAR